MLAGFIVNSKQISDAFIAAVINLEHNFVGNVTIEMLYLR